jgi:hypothetical protein
MQGLERYYARNRPMVFDETETDRPGSVVRREAWAFLLSGGAGYNHLDSSFMIDDETGSGRAEWDGKRHDYRRLRRQLGYLKRFMEGLNFLQLRHETKIVRSAPEGVKTYALSERRGTYALYLDGKGSGELVLNTPDGRYRAEWVSPRTGQVVQIIEAESRSGSLVLRLPAYSEDLALRVFRRVQGLLPPGLRPRRPVRAAVQSYGGPGLVRHSLARVIALPHAVHQLADVAQVASHIGLDVAARRIGLEKSPALKPDRGDRVDNRGDVDLALAEVVGIVLDVKLAYPIPS